VTQPPIENSDVANKRSSARIDARIEVKISTQKEFEICYSQNISRGGIFLETSILPDPNANIELVLNLSSLHPAPAQHTIELRGRVVRLITINERGRTTHKVGIQFVDLSPQTQVLLDHLYNDLTRDNPSL